MKVQYLLTGDIGLPGAAGETNSEGVSGAVTGNKWCVSLKYRIRDFAIEYGTKFNLDRAKKVKSLDDRLFQAVERGIL